MQAFLSLPPFCACGIIFLLSCVKKFGELLRFPPFLSFFFPLPFPPFSVSFSKNCFCKPQCLCEPGAASDAGELDFQMLVVKCDALVFTWNNK